MCFSGKADGSLQLSEFESRSSFHATRLNSTTFRIVEQDAFGERPFIYVKIYADVLVVVDTGCNAPKDADLPVTSLRQYLEAFPVHENNNEPLNQGGRQPYLIILSHCHYDHIGTYFAETCSSFRDNWVIICSETY
jgi:glyoxylase-like metal-dependent hydrolase (beta-lactamase superfamily II)